MSRRERGLYELFARDPERADWEAWHRRSHPQSRRGFLRGLGVMSAVLGLPIAFPELMPRGLIPAVLANSNQPFQIEGKEGLVLLNDRPLNAESMPHFLNDDVTPTNRLFIRNNGIPPSAVDPKTWTLTVDGESVAQQKTYTLSQLQAQFEHVSRQITLECGGNGRAEFDPPVSGNQWTLGAVGSPVWDGMRLRDLLLDVGVKDDAQFVAYHGKDVHASGDPNREAISRGISIGKAMDAETVLAWGMNGGPLHPMNGHPLRLVSGGQPGSASGKWLKGISIRNQRHDGPKMQPPAYHVPCEPVPPGTQVPDSNMCMIEWMPIKSLITSPESGVSHDVRDPLHIHGHAWGGEHAVVTMHTSIDYGTTWQQINLQSPVNRFAWQHFDHAIKFPQPGYYEIWGCAVDTEGYSQPMVLPGWNPKGYLNNACHRIGVYVA